MDSNLLLRANKSLFDQLSQNSATPASQSDSRTQKALDALQQQANQHQDKVSISYKAEKMRAISAEFFNGPMKSSQINELTQRLYEGGFLTEVQFNSLTGTSKPISAVSDAASSFNRFIMAEGGNLDSDTTKALIGVARVLENINAPVTEESRAHEQAALQFISDFAKEWPADKAEDQEVFSKVQDVLAALDKTRNQAKSAAIAPGAATYSQVQRG